MNIVTIDFDIIMEPSINLYNESISETDTVDEIIEDFSFLQNIPADMNIYEYVSRYIIFCLKNNVPIIFIDNHNEIINNIADLVSKEDKFNLYNIDHHHDIFYQESDAKRNIKIPDAGNWIKSLKDKNYQFDYYWIHNDNSISGLESTRSYLHKSIDLSQINLLNISADALIICRSFSWVPMIYYPLFSIWETLVEEDLH